MRRESCEKGHNVVGQGTGTKREMRIEMETGAVTRAQVRKVKHRHGQSIIKMAGQTGVHTQDLRGNKGETQEAPGKKGHPACLAQLQHFSTVTRDPA